jgi:hypothetical protein
MLDILSLETFGQYLSKSDKEFCENDFSIIDIVLFEVNVL